MEGTTPQLHMGLPAPGTDFETFNLDLNQYLITNPISTFFMRLDTSSLKNKGIFLNDILVVDRSIPPAREHLTVIEKDGELKIGFGEKTFLQNAVVWGIVKGIVRKLI